MKLIDKLAEEAALGWLNEMAAIHFYKEGFRKAREMIIKALEDEDSYEWERHVIERVGEEEV